MRTRSWFYLSAVVVTISAAPSSAALAQKVVTAQEASQHVGEVVTVTGTIGGVGHSPRSNTTFINFGAPFPSHDFTAVIFASAAKQFPNVDSWEGKTASVTGVVKMYRGKPEIVLNSPSQIKMSK
jgi:DNA/RNA endonuclease YhcR with UshA esterase domain